MVTEPDNLDDEPYDLDDCVENANWIKKTWDLPPYKSAEFFAIVDIDTLDSFRNGVAYKSAVQNGLIHDDEWVADFCKSSDSTAEL